MSLGKFTESPEDKCQFDRTGCHVPVKFQGVSKAGSSKTGAIASDQSAVALLLIDVINDFAFPEAARLLRHALPAARRIAALKMRLVSKGVPVIYVNDNFGRWRSDFAKQVEHCLESDAGGRAITKLLQPGAEDYFVLKPKHSGFYSTTLDVLLQHLGVKKVILCGFAGDICVLYTANDAYMRGFDIVVPSDCVASETVQAKRLALKQMKRFLKAEIVHSSGLRLSVFQRDCADKIGRSKSHLTSERPSRND
jgi:nicotinamidase-related amidase